ncbi:MAG: Asp-tRNA(Asn)/Glu-tRNA(Gln) amidotransferase GatCAB subunit C [Bdellovibrionaceae bacterium]|nr:Asp-tRNA(Asn)/Glu-tRNA(Gln) amidotransferase GatCAB subunit C [Pseudobdellovibrionaceae bacterium]|tara:strand:- start:1011 stop:1310 length:300 start_codon:yes stop_codon:yes gene_type:complete
MAKVDVQLTEKVASLARLALSKEEKSSFTEQLGQILGYIEKISEVNVDGVEPMINPHDQILSLREDVAAEPFLNEEGNPKILDSAPDQLYDGFKVPQIL